ncbi:MAG TPA: hypothetical protein VHF27_03120 [Acidimicrobiales bacterium]|nr:hypothetical protein [Acidimicrobiales bacterium]
MLELLTVSDFARRVGERFSIAAGDGARIDAELIEATAVGEGARPGSRLPFSLVFRGPGDPVLAQRMYRVEHASLDSLDIFLVPIGPDSTGMRYEAVFT